MESQSPRSKSAPQGPLTTALPSSSKLSRRETLRRALLGGTVVAAASAMGLSVWSSVGPQPTAPLRVLTARDFQILVAITRRIVTVPGADAVAIAQNLDTSLSFASRELYEQFKLALRLVESGVSCLVIGGRLGPFTHLSPEAQDAVLDGWRTSRLAIQRGAYQSLRKLCLTTYYSLPDSWTSLGYYPASNLAALAHDDSMDGAAPKDPP